VALQKEYKDKVDVEHEIALFRETLQEEESSKSSKSRTISHPRSTISSVDGSSIGSHHSGKKRRTAVNGSESEGEFGWTSSSPRRLDPVKANQIHHLLQMTPIVPSIVLRKVAAMIKTNLRKKTQFVEQVARYWSLKRESRRGAPLLKRLHLEPWTATASATKQDESVKAKRHEILRYIRNDLERARLLSELVKKREKEKLRKAQVQLKYLEILIFPVTYVLRPILEEIIQ
jgi:hypothetical protein